MNDYVIVIRLNTNVDLLAILVRDNEDNICVEHPYYVHYGVSGTISLMPYCSLTDETYFEIKKDRIDFVVTASDKIAEKFVTTINPDVYADAIEEEPIGTVQSDLDNIVERLADILGYSTYITGNDTKH